MRPFQLVAFLTCTGSLNSSSDNWCGCTVELIPVLKHSIACLTHTCFQYCVCPDVCADTEGTAILLLMLNTLHSTRQLSNGKRNARKLKCIT